MTASVEDLRIRSKARPAWACYLRAAAASVGRWAQRGQLGAASSRDVGRATGARC